MSNREKLLTNIKKYHFKDFKNIELRACGVYAIRNKITGQTYIGSTGETFKQRWGEHLENLVYKTHTNYLLLDSWREYGYEKFEFVILKPITYECDREHIYRLEQQYIDQYLIDNIELFNIILNTIKPKEDERLLHLKAKERFKELFVATFPDNELDVAYIDEIVDSNTDTIEKMMECVEGITLMEYEGVLLFISQNIANRGKVRWSYDSFDICTCNTISCQYYDTERHYCKKYDEDMTEIWYKPTWCYRFYNDYIIDPTKYDKNGTIHTVRRKGDDDIIE